MNVKNNNLIKKVCFNVEQLLFVLYSIYHCALNPLLGAMLGIILNTWNFIFFKVFDIQIGKMVSMQIFIAFAS